ncbi:hypothetical protein [Escherichia coli ISC41]|nr:hypothetical protein [Escherichia coli ISC41]
MQWAAPEYRSEQGKIQSLSQQMEKIATALPEGGETGHSRESDGI